MKTIGLIGAGHIGSQVARLAVRSGYDVVISNSRGPETLVRSRRRARPQSARGNAGRSRERRRHRRRDGSAEELSLGAGGAAEGQDRHRHQQLLPAARWPHRQSSTTSRPPRPSCCRRICLTSKVVKAFNHIYAAQLTTDGTPAGTTNRRALVIAGNDAAAKATVTRLLDQFGFDTVDAGPLSESWRIQRDTPGYGPRRNAEELRKDLAAAKRYAEMR